MTTQSRLSDAHPQAFAAYCENEYVDVDNAPDDAHERFEDAYLGEWQSVVDYAEDYIYDCYNLESMMGDLYHYFDYKAYARDLVLGGDIWVEEVGHNRVFVFSNH